MLTVIYIVNAKAKNTITGTVIKPAEEASNYSLNLCFANSWLCSQTYYLFVLCLKIFNILDQQFNSSFYSKNTTVNAQVIAVGTSPFF